MFADIRPLRIAEMGVPPARLGAVAPAPSELGRWRGRPRRTY
jgi:hypothetical protein